MRDIEAEIAAQEALQKTDPKRAHAEQPRIRRLADEVAELARRARDLVRP
jgi:hypothetical protein